MHQMIAEEFCYFQLRMLCEAIACGCLVAHGDITRLQSLERLRREWSADKIIKEIGKLHANFYPRACVFTITTQIDIADKKDGFLTKLEFLKLYGQTHSRTHRGSLKDLGTRPPYTNVNFAPIVKWADKIHELLNNHLIQSPDRKQNWLVILKSPQMGGHPLVAHAAAP